MVIIQCKCYFRPDIYSRGSYNRLKFTRFCNPFMTDIIKITESLFINRESYLTRFPSINLIFLKPFNSLTGRGRADFTSRI